MDGIKVRRSMKVEIAQQTKNTSNWRVDVIGDLDIYTATFSGPNAEARARQYRGLLAGEIKPGDNAWCVGMPKGWPGCNSIP
jgi:hypothetical protein